MKIDNFTNFIKNEGKEEEKKAKEETKKDESKAKSQEEKKEDKKKKEDKECKDGKKCNENKIKNFADLIEEKELHNELPKNTDPAQDVKLPGPNNNMKTAPKIKNISTFLDDVKSNILSCCKEKGVAISTYAISGNVGINVKDVHNVLENLKEEGKVSKKLIGDQDYWTAI